MALLGETRVYVGFGFRFVVDGEDEPEPVRLQVHGGIVEAYRMKMQKARAAHLEEQNHRRRRTVAFLEKYHFDPDDVNDVNAGKGKRCLGLLRSWQRPLHQAVKDHNEDMIFSLLKFGADPTRKDSKGKTAYDHVKCSTLRRRMRRLHSMVQTQGALNLTGHGDGRVV